MAGGVLSLFLLLFSPGRQQRLLALAPEMEGLEVKGREWATRGGEGARQLDALLDRWRTGEAQLEEMVAAGRVEEGGGEDERIGKLRGEREESVKEVALREAEVWPKRKERRCCG